VREAAASDLLREWAVRVVRVHPLRAADAMQLAAAMTAAKMRPSSLEFVTADRRLAAAAAREGFTVRMLETLESSPA
jgi:predicted nucleic acid-binding protein